MNTSFSDEYNDLFEEMGVFFSFSNEQFNKLKKPNTEYCSLLGIGDAIPVNNVSEFKRKYKLLGDALTHSNISEYGIERIIEVELINQEAYFTEELDGVVESLASYNVDYEMVEEVFLKTRGKNKPCF